MRALGHEPSQADLKKQVAEVDRDNTGQLDFDGYLNIILNKMAERPSLDDVLKAFRLFDQVCSLMPHASLGSTIETLHLPRWICQDGKKKIEFDDLKRIAGQIGEPIEDGELHEMITEADHSGTGAVGLDDFIKIVTSYAHHYDGEK